jgi:diguanylate cyclase (GGDEF)-like protein
MGLTVTPPTPLTPPEAALGTTAPLRLEAAAVPARRRWPAFLDVRRLQGRMVMLSLGLLIVVQLASLGLIQQAVQVNAEASVDAELRRARALTERLLQQRNEALQAALRLEAAELAKHLNASGQTARVSAPQWQSWVDQRHPVLDGAAAFLMSADEPVCTWAPAQLPWLALLPTLRQAPADTQLVLAQGRLFHRASVAVAERGNLMLVMVQPVDDGELLEIKRLLNVDAALIARSPGQAGQPLVVLEVNPAAAAGMPIAAGMPYELPIQGLPWRGLWNPLVAWSPEGAGVELWLAANLDDALQPYASLKQNLLGLSLLGLALFAAVVVWTARRISAPIARLAQSAESLGRGDYDSPVRVASHRSATEVLEVQELTQAFEAMREGVRSREAEVQRLAFWDPLTLLPNRVQLVKRLQAHMQGGTEPFALLMLNLDRFKPVNDALGRERGDQLLQQVAQRLRPHAGSTYVLARLGGDEFALWLPGADESQAQDEAQRLLSALEQPLRLGEQTVDLGAGIGMALYPAHAQDADDLIALAERAMGLAKRRQSGVAVFQPSMDARSPASLGLLSDLRHALAHDELRLYLQPKLDLVTGQVGAAEALVRWQHPQRGLVPPGLFIPHAEQTGFVRHLTRWVLQASVRHAVAARAQGLALRISVNLSALDLLDVELPHKLAAMLTDEQGTADMLCLEITESAIMDDPERALATANDLSALGFKLSIDDFGTGYSSLAYLKRLPVRELKIDQSFVFGMVNNEGDQQIVRSTIALAHSLGLSVVAEGVETEAALGLLQGWRCDEAQGYFIARPMPADHFGDWLASRRASIA